jgi:hypothetical protein
LKIQKTISFRKQLGELITLPEMPKGEIGLNRFVVENRGVRYKKLE